jgi:sulfatase modifying factor 1
MAECPGMTGGVGVMRLRIAAVFFVLLCGRAASAEVSIDWVTVGTPGNACDPQSEGCFGEVTDVYRISKYETTNAQYAEFLNAVAATDTHGLYSTAMAEPNPFERGGITRSGSSGGYTYSTIAGREKMPVNWVSAYDAMRFANWLHNGQATGDQDAMTTEDGAYTITAGGFANNTTTRNAGATVFLTSEDEWYKAAYFDPSSETYFAYPASSDTPTSCGAPGAAANTANCNEVVNDLTDVGSYSGSAGPNGTFDQGGNLFEWNETIISFQGSSLYRGDRGGSHQTRLVAVLAARSRGFNPHTRELELSGFRVATLPEPTVCGDGVIEGDEQCDDANTDDQDGCDAVCEIERGWVCSDEPSVCSDFPVALNTNAATDSGADLFSHLTNDGVGNWVAVWQSDETLDGTLGTDYDILVARSSNEGATWTVPVPLNGNAVIDLGQDQFPHISTDGVGNWVAVWDSDDSFFDTVGTDTDIFVARSSDAGETWTPPEPLATSYAETSTRHDFHPEVTTDGAGIWMAVWHSINSFGDTIGTDDDIILSRSASAGETWTPPVPLNTNAATDFGLDAFAQLATDGQGNWVAVWLSTDSLDNTIGSDIDIFVSRSDDVGTTWTVPVPLNTNAAIDSGDDLFPEVATDGRGNWVAVWQSEDFLGGTIGPDSDVLYSRSGDAGATWTPPVPLNTNAATDSGDDIDPQIKTDGAGNWMAVWGSNSSLGDTIDTDLDILVAHSSNAGATWTAPVPFNTNATTDSGTDSTPQMTTDGAGSWLTIWQSDDSLGDSIGTDRDILFSTIPEPTQPMLWAGALVTLALLRRRRAS